MYYLLNLFNLVPGLTFFLFGLINIGCFVNETKFVMII